MRGLTVNDTTGLLYTEGTKDIGVSREHYTWATDWSISNNGQTEEIPTKRVLGEIICWNNVVGFILLQV